MSRERNDSESSDRHDYLVKLRGVPHSANKEDIRKFLHRNSTNFFDQLSVEREFLLLACAVVTVHLFDSSENTSGDCLVNLESEADVTDALKNSGRYLDNKTIEGRR